jgi:hypothetical protein
MKRREFITLLSGAAASWPRAALGQQPAKSYRIAIIHPFAGGRDAKVANYDFGDDARSISKAI